MAKKKPKKSKAERATRSYRPDYRARASRAKNLPPEVGPLPPNTEPDDWVIAREGLFLSGGTEPDVFFHAPVVEVLLLDYAAERAARAAGLRRQALRGLQKRPDGAKEPKRENQSKALDAVAEEVASISCAYMALEAFLNRSLRLHRGYTYTDKKKGEVSAEKIEDGMAVEDKLKKVMPDIYGVALTERQKSDYADLKKLRRALEHMRGRDVLTVDHVEESTVGKMLRGDLDAPRIVAEIMTQFVHDLVPPETWRKIEKRSKA